MRPQGVSFLCYNTLMDSSSDINQLIDDFLEHVEVEKGRSKKTVENYRLYLYRFYAICSELLQKDNFSPAEIDAELLRKSLPNKRDKSASSYKENLV